MLESDTYMEERVRPDFASGLKAVFAVVVILVFAVVLAALSGYHYGRDGARDAGRFEMYLEAEKLGLGSFTGAENGTIVFKWSAEVIEAVAVDKAQKEYTEDKRKKSSP